MPLVDATAQAALGAQVVQPAYFGYLDFLGDPLRATTFGADVSFAGTGDTDLDGFTFVAMDPRFISVGDIADGEGGSETTLISLSGIISIDTALLNLIGDRSKWYRRTARLWMRVHDEAGTQQGAIIPYRTCYMTDVRIVPAPKSQIIEVEAENYLTILKEASHRTYLDQSFFDSGDLSAKATIGAANGARTGPASTIGIVTGDVGGDSSGFGLSLREKI